MLAGPIIWLVHFFVIYTANGLNCARPAPDRSWAGLPLTSWLIVMAGVCALVAMVWFYRILRHRTKGVSGNAAFMQRLAAALSLLSAVAIFWETLPVLLVPACG
ncbi:MAG TPA: hypothetical protein DEB15_04910 [Pusillimonas sp.]|nr:hypothetical protein [Pusillimonas sp.]